MVEGATSLTDAGKIARHPDRPDAVDALIAEVREKEAQQKEVERKKRLKDVVARDLARLEMLKAKYETADEGTTASMKRTKD